MNYLVVYPGRFHPFHQGHLASYNYLTKKYGDDFFDQGGLQIYTTIDPKLQDKAEELVARQVKINKDK